MLSHEFYFEEAVKEARKATCLRGKGGAIIVLDGVIVGRGYNSPPLDDPNNAKCHLDYRESRKPKSDRTCCVHAEWRAILEALKNTRDLRGASLYFAGVDETGDMRISGDPYCTVCSRLALDVGIAWFGLVQKDGPKLYPAQEYNDLSYDFHRPERNC